MNKVVQHIGNSQNNIKNVKFLFIAFLLIFISHFVYNNLKVIYSQNNIEITGIINDYESEQENNEPSEEYEELDEYIISNIGNLFSSHSYQYSLENLNHLLLNQYFEVDSPPPIC